MAAIHGVAEMTYGVENPYMFLRVYVGGLILLYSS
jgi:hypothetical protein